MTRMRRRATAALAVTLLLAGGPATAWADGGDFDTTIDTTNDRGGVDVTIAAGSPGNAPQQEWTSNGVDATQAVPAGGGGAGSGGGGDSGVQEWAPSCSESDAGVLCASFTPDEEPAPSAAPASPAAPKVSPEQAARRAVNNLRLEYPTLGVGPNWNKNMWGFIPVGYPAWFWLEGGSTASIQTSQTVDGIYVALYAPPPTVVWDFGDGTSQTCGIGTPLGSGVKPGTPSPDCGHAWPRIGDYEVTVTVTWTIRWTAGGQSGQIPITTSTTTTVPVGELQAVNR